MNMWKALPPVVGVTAAVLLAGCGTDPRTPAVETQTVTVSAAPAPVVEKVEDAEGSEPGPCTDVDLAVSNKPVESRGSEYRLVLAPGDVATADLQARDVHPQTEGPCPRWGSVTVIAPNTFQERPLDVGMPMCGALISSVT